MRVNVIYSPREHDATQIPEHAVTAGYSWLQLVSAGYADIQQRAAAMLSMNKILLQATIADRHRLRRGTRQVEAYLAPLAAR